MAVFVRFLQREFDVVRVKNRFGHDTVEKVTRAEFSESIDYSVAEARKSSCRFLKMQITAEHLSNLLEFLECFVMITKPTMLAWCGLDPKA